MAIKAFSGAVSTQPLPDFNLNNIVDGDILIYNTATKSFINSNGSFATLAEVNQLIANINGGGSVDLSAYHTIENFNTAKAALDAAIALKADKTYVDAQIAGISNGNVDLSNYVTTGALSSALLNYSTSTQTTGEINTAIANATFFDGDYNNLHNTPTIPTLTGYATQLWVQQQINAIDNSGNVDLSNYVTTTALNTALSNLSIPTDVSDLTDTTNLLNSGSGGGISTAQLNAAIAVEETRALTAEASLQTQINDKASTSYVDQQIANVSSGGSVDLSSYVTETELQTELANYQPSIDLSNYYTKTQVDGLIPTVFSGDYNDLTNKPTIPTAFSGDYADLTNKPTIPDTSTFISETAIDSKIASAISGGTIDLSNYVTDTELATAISNATLGGGVTTIGALTDVAIDGTETTNHVLMYNAVNSLWENVDLDETFATKQYVTDELVQAVSNGTVDLAGYASESWVTQKLVERGDHFSGNYNDLVNTPILFSGDYTDLINKPASNADLSLQLIGQDLQLLNVEPDPDTVISTVSLSSLGDAIASNIDYADLQNLPNLFSGNYNDLVNRPNLFSGSYPDLANKPYIPSIAGLASETYVNDKWAEPEITGDRFFTHNVTQVAKVSNVVAATAENYVMSIITTDATPTEALLTTGSRIVIDDNSTVMYKVHIVGSDGTDHCGFKLQGIINKTSGTLALVGSPSKETLEDTTQIWTGSVEADITNSSLKIIVTGDTAKTVQWTIFVEQNSVKR